MALQKLFSDATGKASSFVFNFKTKSLRFDLVVDGLKATNLTAQELVGSIHTSDQVPTNLIEQSLSAQQSGKDLPIIWIS